MGHIDQRRKAQALLDLHIAEPLLVLPNVWDVVGARVLAATGYPAVATASAAMSASLGFADGQRLTRRTMLEVVGRISRAVELPVTADMESGYGATPGELADTVSGLLDCGAVGLNIEDSLHEGGALRPIDEQAGRIAHLRATADARDIHLVINARIDSFLSNQYDSLETRIEEAVARAAAYGEAGADCIYPIGPGDEHTLAQLRHRIDLPINVLATPQAVKLPKLQSMGINRVSFGPFVFRSCLHKFVDIAEALAAGAGYDCFGDMLSGEHIAAFLRSDPENRAFSEDRT